jgi:hypothetical protein
MTLPLSAKIALTSLLLSLFTFGWVRWGPNRRGSVNRTDIVLTVITFLCWVVAGLSVVAMIW